MSTTRIRFAKLIATPHETSWSQAYNAGGLFLVFSLSKEKAKAETILNALGKDIINNIEAEFFTLEDKTLETIGTAITEALAAIDPDITLNLCLAYNKDDILYLFLYGSGKIVMKRDGKAGTLLQQAVSTKELKRASGRLESGDTILLATHAFAVHFSPEHIDDALSHADPEKAVDGLTPLLENTENGEVASLFLSYTEPEPVEDESVMPTEPLPPIEPEAVAPSPAETNTEKEEAITPEPEVHHPAYETTPEPNITQPPRRKSMPRINVQGILTRFGKKKLILFVLALILILILSGSIMLALGKIHNKKQTALFHSLYDPAQKEYDEGVGLENLNASLAQNDFTKAKQQLDQLNGKFPKGSDEEKQVTTLSQQVADKLAKSGDAHIVEAKEVTSGSALLTALKKNTTALAITEDTNTLYLLTSKAVTKMDSDGGNAKDIITNDSDWSDAVGISVYLGNVYILDKKNGVLKFVAGSGGFGKNSYFPNDAKPDLSQATALAIDGSVWIVTGNGNVLRFTKGKSDDVKVSGLETPLSHPVKIVTNADMQNVYILDPGTSRIVVLHKDGSFKGQYTTTILSKATQLDIDEKGNKAFVLSGGKMYEIDL